MWRTTVLVLLCRHPTDFSQFKSVIQIGDLSLWYPIHRYSRPDLIALHSHGNDSIAVSRGHFGEKSRLLWAAGGGSAFLEPIATFRGLRWPSNCPGLLHTSRHCCRGEESRTSEFRKSETRSIREALQLCNCSGVLCVGLDGCCVSVWPDKKKKKRTIAQEEVHNHG